MFKLIDVDDKKWKKFRKKCVQNDTTMKDKINEWVTRYIDDTPAFLRSK